MSSAVLDAARRPRGGPRRQTSLFDDLVREPPAARSRERERGPTVGAPEPAEARFEPHPRSGGDRQTLEAHLERIWESLIAAGAAECPVCGGELRATGSGGACRGCGSALR